jgi:glutamate racemase
MIVVACNSAAAAALDALQERLTIPVIGVIEPGMRAAMAVTSGGRVGVIGTVGTVASGAYQRCAPAFSPVSGVPVTLTCAACPGFVEFVEAGDVDSDQVHVLAERLLAPVREARVDTLVLGCTHYPFLEGAISYVMGQGVSLVSSDTETAKDVYRQLVSRDLLAGPDAVAHHVYEATGSSADDFIRLAHRLMGREVRAVQLVQTGAIDIPR